MPSMSRAEQAFCRSAPWRRFTQRAVLPWALQHRELRGSVLEIGGGNGAMAEAMLRYSPDVTLTTTDYDPSMVESARRRLAPFGNRVHVEQVDATRLPYDDDRFDAVVSFIMLHHVIDWEAAIGEAVRAVRRGGVVLGYDLLDTTMTRLTHWLERSEARPMRTSELQTRVAALPVDAEIREAGRGFVVRFVLTKQEIPTTRDAARSSSEPART
jgi:ubiquinone/menaquinone biosynthesis C-methylase UbiE